MPTKSKSSSIRLLQGDSPTFQKPAKLGMDTSGTSSIGDGSPPALLNPEAMFINGLDHSLLSAYDSSSSESSYWSDSDDSSDEEDSSDDNKNDSDGGYISGGPGAESGTEGNETENDDDAVDNRRRRAKRSDSVLSLDALLKVSLQVSDVKKPQPKNKEDRRRGRRLNRDHTATSLGALARKVGSSTDNDLKTSVSTMRRCDSSSNLPAKKVSSITSFSMQPKKTFIHVQQEGFPGTKPRGTTPRRHRSRSANGRKSVSPGPGERIRAGAPAPAPRVSATSGNNRPSTTPTRGKSKYGEHATKAVKPKDHYLSILRAAGVEAPLMPYNQLGDFFVPLTIEDRAAFDWELVQSIRDHNMEKLQRLHKAGHHMSARAQFGESIVHICARRGTPEMLKYLLEEACVSPRVCCDYGRTPLHDAAWSTDAKSLKMMQILITACPDLLLILDKRGFMPLDYIPKDRWPHCCAFLDKYKTMLLPTGVLFGEGSGSDDDSGESEYESGSASDLGF